MKQFKTLLLLTALISTPVLAQKVDAANNTPIKTFKIWQPVGNALPGVFYQQLALNGADKPYLAAQEQDTETIMTLDHGTWVPVGPSEFAANIFSGSLAINKASKTAMPYFAYTKNIHASGGSVIVKHLDGNKFDKVGKAVCNYGASGTHALAVAQNGTPYIFYLSETNGKSDGQVKKYDTTTKKWINVGGSIPVNYSTRTDSEEAQDLSIQIASNNQPYIAWYVHGSMHVMTYINKKWTMLGTLSTPNFSDGEGTPFAVGPKGHVYIATSSNDMYYHPEIFELQKNGSWKSIANLSSFIADLGTQSIDVASDGTVYYSFNARMWNNPANHSKMHVGRGGIYTVALKNGRMTFIGDRTGGRMNQFISIRLNSKNVPYITYQNNSTTMVEKLS